MTSQFLTAFGTAIFAAPCFPAVAGPFWRYAPQGTVEPYCVYFNVGPGLPDHFTDGTYIEKTRIQVSIFHTDPDAAWGFIAQIRSTLNKETIPLTSGHMLGLLTMCEPYDVPIDVRDKSPSAAPIYHVALDLRPYLTNA